MRLDRALALVLMGSLAHAAPAAADTSSPHTLNVSATVPVIEVAAREASSRTYALPALDYTLDLSTACARPFDPVSLVVTVADSHRHINAQQLAQEAGKNSVVLVVPADQLAPIAAPEFCQTLAADNGTVASPATAAETLTIAGVLSATLSLRCSDGEREEIVYRSQPLDLTLRCETNETPTTNSLAGDSE